MNRANPIAAAALAVGLMSTAAAPALAQTVSGGTSGGLGGEDVSASTSGYGEQTTTPEGTSIGVGGDANAVAGDGGTATTRADAKLNERRAMQRSTANARDDDERARSRTRTVVRDGEVRSRTMSIYHQKGEKAQHEMDYSVTTPEGTVTKTK